MRRSHGLSCTQVMTSREQNFVSSHFFHQHKELCLVELHKLHGEFLTQTQSGEYSVCFSPQVQRTKPHPQVEPTNYRQKVLSYKRELRNNSKYTRSGRWPSLFSVMQHLYHDNCICAWWSLHAHRITAHHLRIHWRAISWHCRCDTHLVPQTFLVKHTFTTSTREASLGSVCLPFWSTFLQLIVIVLPPRPRLGCLLIRQSLQFEQSCNQH